MRNVPLKRYCFVIEIKEEFVEQYCEVHRKAWRGILKAIKNIGAKEFLINRTF
jgi:L-rhamnose mutarotase